MTLKFLEILSQKPHSYIMSFSITPSLLDKINAMRASQNAPDLKLRITVEGGGCSGFQYIYKWDASAKPDDIVIDNAVLTDPVSIPFLSGATIDYVVSLMGENFKITNPNASSGCGCGTSFAV